MIINDFLYAKKLDLMDSKIDLILRAHIDSKISHF